MSPATLRPISWSGQPSVMPNARQVGPGWPGRPGCQPACPVGGDDSRKPSIGPPGMAQGSSGAHRAGDHASPTESPRQDEDARPGEKVERCRRGSSTSEQMGIRAGAGRRRAETVESECWGLSWGGGSAGRAWVVGLVRGGGGGSEGCEPARVGKDTRLVAAWSMMKHPKGGSKPTKEGFECKRRKEWALSLCLRTDQGALGGRAPLL